MKAIIFLEWPHEQTLPDYFKDGSGGYACIGHIPTESGDITVLWVDVTEAIYNQLVADANIMTLGTVGMVATKEDLSSINLSIEKQEKAKEIIIAHTNLSDKVVNDKDLSTAYKMVEETSDWFNVPDEQIFRLLSGQEEDAKEISK